MLIEEILLLQQMPGQPQYNNQYAPSMGQQRPQSHMMPGHGPGPGGGGAGGPMMNKYNVRRPSPYQNPSMMKRQPYMNGTQVGFSEISNTSDLSFVRTS